MTAEKGSMKGGVIDTALDYIASCYEEGRDIYFEFRATEIRAVQVKLREDQNITINDLWQVQSALEMTMEGMETGDEIGGFIIPDFYEALNATKQAIRELVQNGK